jgi:predicted ABC-type ATPase
MIEKEVLIFAGPNGAGKTTIANRMLDFKLYHFLNADQIASQLAENRPEDANAYRVEAGKIFIRNIYQLIESEKNFFIETTLAGKYLERVIARLKEKGYRVKIIFIFLESPDLASQRVKQRVLKGGHPIPEHDIKRRYYRSKNKFWDHYKNLADKWFLAYNSGGNFHYIAVGEGEKFFISDEILYRLLFKKKKIEDNRLTALGSDTYMESFEILRIGNAAVKEVQKVNIELGIPNAFSKNTNLFYEFPDGTISQENPFEENLDFIREGE